MATNIVQGKWDHVKEEEEENAEKEEESLSLCDLPITLINMKDQDKPRKEDSCHVNEAQEEFDFRFSKEQEMSAADDVFFQGQILPLRPSFNSEAGSLSKHDDHHKGNHQFNHSESVRSESLEFQSNSSRSSSVRSQNSSSRIRSTITTPATTTTTPRISISKPRIQNQFHTHSSPKRQLKKSTPKQTSGRKSSSTWELFRIGVVPTPEIGLQDLKVRSTTAITTIKSFPTDTYKNCHRRNNSGSICNSTRKSVKMSNKTPHHNVDKNNHHVFKQFVHKGGGFFNSGCMCSAETVRYDNVMIKGGTKSANNTESTQHAKKEKVVLKKQKKRHKKKQQGKSLNG